MNPPTTAWLVTAFGNDRQYAGNTGYADEVSSHYRYDSKVPNHLQVSAGDVMVLRDRTHVLGVATIQHVDVEEASKVLNLCPTCERSGLKVRKTRFPRYRCHACKTEFDTPTTRSVDVKNFTARFGGSFVKRAIPLELARIQSACRNYNGQLAMQRIDMAALGAYGEPLRDAIDASRQKRHEVEPTADPLELERRVRALRGQGRLGRPRGRPAPGRARAGGGLVFLRDPLVKAWVLQEAAGSCEACGGPGPFRTEGGEPFLEVHHLVPLADGGPDTVENALAVCPNCHRAFHHAEDRLARRGQVRERVGRLRESGV